MSASLLGKVVIVTGASRGIGKCIAQAFSNYGAKVVISDINDTEGEATVKSINSAGGNAVYFHADTSIPESHQQLVDFTLNTYGRLDIACNNAGILHGPNKLADIPLDSWRKVISVNLDGVFYGIRAQIPAMLKTGGGLIVNISSILGQVAFPDYGGYVAAKHGVVGLTQQIALDYASQNIRSVAIGPAFIKTKILDGIPPEVFEGLKSLHPIGRLGEPEEIGEAVAAISCDGFHFLNGAYIPIDGGYLCK